MPFSSRPSPEEVLAGSPEAPAHARPAGRALRVLTVVLAACALIGSYIVAGIVHEKVSDIRAGQLATRSQVPATLLESAGANQADASEPVHASTQVQARWTAPNGDTATGLIAVGSNASAGDKHTLWVDRSGDPATPPIGATQMAMLAISAGVGVNAAAAAVYVAASRSARALATRRRLRAIDTEWAELEPEWSRR